MKARIIKDHKRTVINGRPQRLVYTIEEQIDARTKRHTYYYEDQDYGGMNVIQFDTSCRMERKENET